jgi:hypothetical protein
VRRAADPDRLTRPRIRVVIPAAESAAFEGTGVDAPDLAREITRPECRRQSQPCLFGLGTSDAGEQAHLRPGDLACGEGVVDRGQVRESGVDVGEVVESARRKPDPLDGVVAQACKSEPLPGAPLDEAAGDGGERASQRPPGASDRGQLALGMEPGTGVRGVTRACSDGNGVRLSTGSGA